MGSGLPACNQLHLNNMGTFQKKTNKTFLYLKYAQNLKKSQSFKCIILYIKYIKYAGSCLRS